MTYTFRIFLTIADPPEKIETTICNFFRWRPFVTSPADLDDGPNVVLLTIFLYSCNNLMEFEDGSKIEGNDGIPEENQVVIKVTLYFWIH